VILPEIGFFLIFHRCLLQIRCSLSPLSSLVNSLSHRSPSSTNSTPMKYPSPFDRNPFAFHALCCDHVFDAKPSSLNVGLPDTWLPLYSLHHYRKSFLLAAIYSLEVSRSSLVNLLIANPRRKSFATNLRWPFPMTFFLSPPLNHWLRLTQAWVCPS
jgi:hypothetical protein